MNERDTFELLLDELVNYYNGDVLPDPVASLTAEDFTASARRLVAFHEERAKEVADLLLRLSKEPSNPKFVEIESNTLFHWNGTPEDWATFQRLASEVNAAVGRLLAEAGRARTEGAGDRQAPSARSSDDA